MSTMHCSVRIYQSNGSGPYWPAFDGTACRFWCENCGVWWSGSHCCVQKHGISFNPPTLDERLREIIREEVERALRRQNR